MSNIAIGKWYVVYVKSRCEKKVNDFLNKVQIQTYLPLLKKVEKWSDRKKTVYKPLFPSYLFVHVNETREFNRIRATDGVCDFIRFGGKLANVSENEINNIKLFLSKELSDVKATSSTIRAGEIRKIQHGLLKGLECEIIKTNRNSKVVVRIDSIYMQLTACLPVNYLQFNQIAQP